MINNGDVEAVLADVKEVIDGLSQLTNVVSGVVIDQSTPEETKQVLIIALNNANEVLRKHG